MTITFSPTKFALELGRRAVTQGELARLAGVSETTVSAAANGRRLKPGSARKIATALQRIDPISAVDALL